MRFVKAAAVQLSPVLYSREGTVEKVVAKIHELGAWFGVRATARVSAPWIARLAALVSSPAGSTTTLWRVTQCIVGTLTPILRLLLGDAHAFLRLLVSATIQVSLMTYLVMPRVTRWLGRWLFPK